MGRFIVTVIDGFGIGAMHDNIHLHQEDEHANTCKSILSSCTDSTLPTLESLGLGNLIEDVHLSKNPNAIWGKCALKHRGADTFMGHQEIMGSHPKLPIKHRFKEFIIPIKKVLEDKAYHVVIQQYHDFQYLVVNKALVISDNIDSDLGQAINCIATFDLISFEELLNIAHIVREHVTCNRVIAFGGSDTTLQKIINAQAIKEEYYCGHVAVDTGVYEHHYQVRHLGYGIEYNVQVPTILGEKGIPVVLIGKVADIIQNTHGKNIYGVNSEFLLNQMESTIKDVHHGFICTNIQESDLAGHSMNVNWYNDILNICDVHIRTILTMLHEDDIFVVCADHGNDPLIGHNQHTREYTPLLVYKKNKKGIQLGTRSTLADIGATICEYFGCEPCEYGTSFLSKLL